MTISETLLPEFDQEMGITRKVIERIPSEKGDWVMSKAPNASPVPGSALSVCGAAQAYPAPRRARPALLPWAPS